MRFYILMLMSLVLCSCTTVNETNNYGFLPKPGMNEDAQDRNNTKYNLMDSADGSQDPNAYIKVWGAKY